ncbi:hypothetical protein M9H77_08462 [Catharanthus roseus]|uniref:Uncharacterized protein n=1 Tax=Catharanthus roseus TaxID=4058 RepID=A0ACC0BXV3_CATRO|nr:hypothetical protein M9H77_08462 [Catharanthus roseus]
MPGQARFTRPTQDRIAEGSFFYRLLDVSATGASTRFTDVRRCSASTAGLVIAVFATGSNTAVVGKLSVSTIPVCFYSDGPCRFAVFGVRCGIGRQERRRSFSVIV